MDKLKILCVDDEIDNLDALERLFRKKYTVLKASSADKGLAIIQQHQDIAVIISDQKMPETTGVEFLEQTLIYSPLSSRILLTGYSDLASIIDAVNKGQIYSYLTKPWDSTDFLNTVDHAAERFVLQTELQQKNKDLAHALNELQVLDKAKNNFMVLINHELRTPLTSILSYTELLRESNLDSDQRTYLLRVENNALRLKSLIEDVLLIIRAETQQLQIHPSPIYLGHLEQELPEHIQQILIQKQQQLAAAPFPEAIWGDERLIRLVIHRLIHNAAKFGEVKSIIQLDWVKIENTMVRIMIYNQGPAIAEPLLKKILQPFFIDENVMNHSSGMGLGLTVCQAILKNHGSQLQIKNQEHGVSVFFDLPLATQK